MQYDHTPWSPGKLLVGYEPDRWQVVYTQGRAVLYGRDTLSPTARQYYEEIAAKTVRLVTWAIIDGASHENRRAN